MNAPNELKVLNQMNKMNLIFAFLSTAYIFMIFFFAGSPAVSIISPYNPFSLLHIPLYGILTLLIVFALVPFNAFPFSRIRKINKSESDVTNSINAINSINVKNAGNLFSIAGLISFIVAVADEYHQIFIPTREASFTDVLLDVVGIALAILITFRFYRMQRAYVNQDVG
jgi:VanZ family protein